MTTTFLVTFNDIYFFQLNPPYYIPLVELVPSPWTDPDVVSHTRHMLEELGQSLVTLKKEVLSFIAPRLQNAMIMEGIRLVNVSFIDLF